MTMLGGLNPIGARDFSLLQNMQTVFRAHLASFAVGFMFLSWW